METFSANRLSRFVFEQGHCSFRTATDAVLSQHELTTWSRPRALISEVARGVFASQLATRLDCRIVVTPKPHGFVYEFTTHPHTEHLATPMRYEITREQLASDTDAHFNEPGAATIEWMLRWLYGVPFRITQTPAHIRWDPPGPRARYSTPPLARSKTDAPDNKPASKRKK